MNVLFSIKPRFVKEIVNGRKKYEFRKAVPKNKAIKNVYIYSSAPTQMIVAKFTPGQITCDTPEKLWSKFGEWAGIDKDEFFGYFQGKETGFAIAINDLDVFEKPVDPRLLRENFTPPQSFCYVGEI